MFTASFAYCTLYLWLTVLDAHMHIANKFCEALVGVQVKKYHITAFTCYCMFMWE